MFFVCLAITLLTAQGVQSKCPADVPDCPYINNQDVERLFRSLKNVTKNAADLKEMLKTGSLHLTPRQTQELLPLISMAGPYSKQAALDCSEGLPSPHCYPSYPYRQIDGTCNNLEHPLLGSTDTCQKRLRPAVYTQNSGFRESVNGGPLPPPRTLSVNVHRSISHPNPAVTNLFVFFGQFMAQDLVHTAISVEDNNKTIDCCLVEKDLYPQCSPITIPPDDYFYSQYGINCINFIRTAICPTCSSEERQQINKVTAFLDASIIYGNHPEEIYSLRTNDGTGRMRSVQTPHGELLPDSSDQCGFLNTKEICFESGDSRSNQNSVLTTLHILFVREHNRIADRLREINPQWDDEIIFQEARRIVGAELQSITYGEWLPVALGPDLMSKLSLTPQTSGYTAYDPSVDPSVFIEFSTAVIRFGHSLVSKVVAEFPGPSNGSETRLLRNDFFKPYQLKSGALESYLTGPAERPCQRFGRNMVPDLTNFLYRRFHGQPGLDLAAINIQRGRDNGLPPYTEIVQLCSDNKTVIEHFDDLVNNNLITRDNAKTLKQNYRDVKDIDLWTGILSETPINTSIGPTGACVLVKQFHNQKFGDRFYFEHGNQVGSFNQDQLQEIRKSTLAKLICENTEVDQIAKNVFRFLSQKNPLIDCQNIDGIDLTFWKE